ncbi:hypothetical protein GQ42DRAFT_153523 [Ramicandelaber brevisporus]|nr:hypothetical protein GQ42DRAFT_153523 [Ramicandelaber brevisporus]
MDSVSAAQADRKETAVKAEGVDGDSGAGRQPRLLKSCVACRRRKVKCCGTRPSCSHCSKAGVACLYVEAPSVKRSWKFLRDSKKAQDASDGSAAMAVETMDGGSAGSSSGAAASGSVDDPTLSVVAALTGLAPGQATDQNTIIAMLSHRIVQLESKLNRPKTSRTHGSGGNETNVVCSSKRRHLESSDDDDGENEVTPRQQLLPPFITDQMDPLLLKRADGSSLHFGAVCTAVNAILTDARSLFQQLTYNYQLSANIQLSDSTPSDMYCDYQKYGYHMSTVCGYELRQFYSHLRQTAPSLYSVIYGREATAFNSVEHNSLVTGHDRLLHLITMLLVITGGMPFMNDSDLSSLSVIEDDEPRSIRVHNGTVVLLTTAADSENNSLVSTVRQVPRPVAQLLLDFLVFVRRPVIESMLCKNKLQHARLLKTYLCVSACSATYQTAFSSSAFSYLANKYFGCSLTFGEFIDVMTTWVRRFPQYPGQVVNGNPPSTSSFDAAIESSRIWDQILTHNRSSPVF